MSTATRWMQCDNWATRGNRRFNTNLCQKKRSQTVRISCVKAFYSQSHSLYESNRVCQYHVIYIWVNKTGCCYAHTGAIYSCHETEAAEWNSDIINFFVDSCTSTLYCASLTWFHVQTVFEHAVSPEEPQTSELEKKGQIVTTDVMRNEHMVSCPWMWPQVWLFLEIIKIRACLIWPLIWLEIYRSCRFIDLLSYYVEFLSFLLLVFSLFGPPVCDQGINLSVPSWRMSQIWKCIPRNEGRGGLLEVWGERRHRFYFYRSLSSICDTKEVWHKIGI